MNRPPSYRDHWWKEHQRTCGGTYVKIKEPDNYGKKKKENPVNNYNCKDLRKMLQIKSGSSSRSGAIDRISGDNTTLVPASSAQVAKAESTILIPSFSGPGVVLDSSVSSGDENKHNMRKRMLEAAEKRRADIGIVRKRTEKRIMDDRDKVDDRPLLKHRKEAGSERSHPFCREKLPSHLISSSTKQEKGSDCILISSDDSDAPGSNIRPATGASTDSRRGSSSDSLKGSRTRKVEGLMNSVEPINLIDLSVNPCQDKQPLDKVAEEDPSLGYWQMTDFKTCPVCGMVNIPSAIINVHVSLCLDAEEEETRLLDSD